MSEVTRILDVIKQGDPRAGSLRPGTHHQSGRRLPSHLHRRVGSGHGRSGPRGCPVRGAGPHGLLRQDGRLRRSNPGSRRRESPVTCGTSISTVTATRTARQRPVQSPVRPRSR